MRRSTLLALGTLLSVSMAACGSSGGTGVGPSTSPVASQATSSSLTAPRTAGAPSGAPVTTVAGRPMEAALTADWATAGPGSAQACTYSPAIDAMGRIWVAACWESAFWIFDSTGHFVEAWGDHGSNPGQFDFAYPASHDSIGGIAFAKDGTFYTFDAGNLRVQHFDAHQKLLGAWGSFGRGNGQFAKPSSIAVAPDGSVLVGDGARNDVQVFSATGDFVRTIATGTAGGDGGFVYLAVDSQGNAYVNGAGSLTKYGADGVAKVTFDVSAVAPTVNGIAIAPNGDILVLSRDDTPNATLLLGADGTLRHLWPGTGESAAFGPDGAAYVADVASDRLTRYTLPTK